VEVQDVSKMKDRLDSISERLDTLDDDVDRLFAWKNESQKMVATPVASSAALPDDLDRRLNRLETRIAEVASNGAEQREKIASRMLDIQKDFLKLANNFGNLEGRVEKVVSWHEERKKTEKRQLQELDEKLEKLENLEERLMNQKSAVEKALEMYLEDSNDTPSVLSFSAVQERSKKKAEVRQNLKEAL